ncbi:MAG TPA: nitroreductase/quinone reductase family protein [Acidimicrobiales bacterium]|nr:nitroreductase/quinone reductase family protein [Acidimicrobiales bacterium]
MPCVEMNGPDRRPTDDQYNDDREEATCLVRAHGLARSPCASPHQRWPPSLDHVEQPWVGSHAAHDDRTAVRQGTKRDHRHIEDGPNLISLAMNGWDEGHPAWWLNLEAHPEAVIRLSHEQPRQVRARLADDDERQRLWARWVEIDPDLLAASEQRATQTPVVVFGSAGQ